MVIMQVVRKLSVIGTVLLFVIAGMFSLVPSATAAEYACGSQCNGKSPSSPISSNGITCSHSAKQIASGHPVAYYNAIGPKLTYEPVEDTDGSITVTVMYSTVCQTMWAVVSNSHGSVPADCSLNDVRTASPTWLDGYGCPAAGSTKTYPMVNDYVSNHGVAANVTFGEQLDREICSDPEADGYTCGKPGVTKPVTFSYQKAY